MTSPTIPFSAQHPHIDIESIEDQAIQRAEQSWVKQPRADDGTFQNYQYVPGTGDSKA